MSPDAAAEGPEAPSGTLINLDDSVVLKACNVFSISRRDGSLPPGVDHPLGVWMNDCRFVCTHELTVSGARPRQLVAAAPSGTVGIHELTNPALRLPDGRALPLQALRVRLERRLADDGSMEETLIVLSYGREPVEFDLEVFLAADFAHMFAVRGIASPGPLKAVEAEPVKGGVRFARECADGVIRANTVTTAPFALTDPGDPGRLRFPLRLAPGAGETIRLRYDFHEAPTPPRAARPPGPPARDDHEDEAWLGEITKVSSDDQLFDRVLRRSLLDVRMLRSELGGRSYYAAGVPWFATLFGRDSLIAAIELLSFDPRMGAGTLRLLASMLGRDHDPIHEEDPGKVLHELRVGEVAALGLTPLTRYYGTVDATSLFLCLLCEHADWTGSLELFRELRDDVDAMLAWIDGPGDRDRDGLLDYMAGTPKGLRNQGWKDSDDGIQDEHAVPLEPPITLVEPQAYTMRAKTKLARLFDADGDHERGSRLRAEVRALSERLETFWLADRGYYSMGFGADRRPSRALASNQGHLLWGGAVAPERARGIRDALMSERMFSGWGIRTLAEGEAGYNPVGYHTGSVWPHDTAIGAVGLRAYGYDEDFIDIFEGLLSAAATANSYRLPELFAGFSRTQFDTTVPYPVACRPQAWAAGALPYLLKSGLGLIPDGLHGRLRIRRPSLPRWVNRVTVRDLRVGDSSIDLTFERVSGSEHVVLADASIRGDVEVVLEISSNRVS